MPGGVTANIKFFEPYPVVMKNGNGAYLADVDDNEYIDFLLSYGSLMTGHGHPKLVKAIQQQFDEVKTGFRVGLGGAQEVYGIKPDITSLERLLTVVFR